MKHFTTIVLIVAMTAGVCVAAAGGGEAGDDYPTRPTVVSVACEPVGARFAEGEPVLVDVRVTNRTGHVIRWTGFGLEPVEWNGEAARAQPVDVYRGDGTQNLWRAGPAVNPPPQIQGMSSRRLGAGESMAVRLDLRKWTIDGGWKPGRYRVTVRARGLQIDQFTEATVMSEAATVVIE